MRARSPCMLACQADCMELVDTGTSRDGALSELALFLLRGLLTNQRLARRCSVPVYARFGWRKRNSTGSAQDQLPRGKALLFLHQPIGLLSETNHIRLSRRSATACSHHACMYQLDRYATDSRYCAVLVLECVPGARSVCQI